MDISTAYKENESLIHYVIKKHTPFLIGKPEYEDAFQEGSIALIKAIKGFNPNLGYEFSTYAYPIIRNSIYRYSYKQDSNLKVSRGSHNAYIKYKYLLKEGKTFDEIAATLNMSAYDLKNIINAFNGNYLNRTVTNQDSEDTPMSLLDVIPDNNPDALDIIEKKFEIKTANMLCKSMLTEKDCRIATLYCSGKTQEEIGKLINVTQAVVSRRLTKIQDKIFPYFKRYIQGNLTYGLLCLKLIKHNSALKLSIKCYLDYALELLNRNEYNEKFLTELESILNDMTKSQLLCIINFLNNKNTKYCVVKENLNNILTIVDSYCSVNGIEEVAYEMASLARNGKYKSHIDKVKEWIKNNPNKLIKVRDILGGENANGYENNIKEMATNELKEEGYDITTKKCGVFNESWLSAGDSNIAEVEAIAEWVLNNRGKGVEADRILMENNLTENINYAFRYSNLARQELLEKGYPIITLQGLNNKKTWGVGHNSNTMPTPQKNNTLNYNIKGPMSKDSVLEILSTLLNTSELNSAEFMNIELTLKIND